MVFDTVLAFDHVKHRILIIANARVTAGRGPARRSTSSPARRSSSSSASSSAACRSRARGGGAAPRGARRTRRARPFESGVRTIQEHIAAGEIYQAVLSQRFEADVDAPPFDVYRALRHVNPSPYMYFIRMGGLAIIGASPEMLVRVEGRHVETHPIAGTRPRGAQRRKRTSGWPRS